MIRPSVAKAKRDEMDFNLRPLGRMCATSGEALAPGSTCWSVLVEVEGKVNRLDISEEHWDGPPEGSLGHWKCDVPDVADGPKKLDTESLWEYFLQLSEAPNLIEQDYQYVLALLLLRKRRLILEETIEIDDRPTMRLIGTGGEGPFDIAERELSDTKVQEIQSQLFGTSSSSQAA